jgi:hypothetical protein
MGVKYGIELTDAIQADICAYIRAGGFPHVAAEAAGVPSDFVSEVDGPRSEASV